MQYFIGIDPGVAGGIVVIGEDGAVPIAIKMPDTERDVYDAFAPWAGLARAVLERVSSSPQMGVVSAFTFGRGVGGLRMALVAAGIPFDAVTPGTWQKAMGVRQATGKTTLGETHKKDKNVAKRRAQELFPSIVVTHAIADALLIAEYGRRAWLGVVDPIKAAERAKHKRAAKTKLF